MCVVGCGVVWCSWCSYLFVYFLHINRQIERLQLLLALQDAFDAFCKLCGSDQSFLLLLQFYSVLFSGYKKKVTYLLVPPLLMLKEL